MRLLFGPFTLEVEEARLLKDGTPVQAQPLVIDVIRFLAERPGQLVTREQLLSGVWPGVRVSDQTLSQAIRRARKALEDDADRERWISTVARRGYRFAEDVRTEQTEARRGGNLPAFLVELIGREQELAALRQRLAGDEPVLTLVGPGGTGKTLLALHAARACALEGFFVDLSPVRDASGVYSALGAALGVRLDPDPVVALRSSLDRPVLVVIDNAEHLLDPVAELIVALLRDTRAPRFLVTSREALRIASEAVIQVPPLSIEAGCELFVRRMSARGQSALSPEDRGVIREIVEALDSIPLAIELAAARTGLLTPREILARLDQPLALLAGTARDATRRHATLRAALQWSWDLLRPEEQQALRCCAVFRGSFTVEAAEAVIGGPSLDAVQALVDKSLLCLPSAPGSAQGRGPSARLAMLSIVRSFVSEHEDRAAIERHAAFYAELGARLHEAELADPAFDPTRVNATERAELLAAVERAPSADQAASALLGLSSLLVREGPLPLLISLGKAILDRAGLGDFLRTRLLRVIGAALPPSEGVVLLDQAHALASASGERGLAGVVAINAGIAWSRLDHARARAWFDIAAESAPETWRGQLLDARAGLDWREGRLEEARRGYLAAGEVFRQAGNQRYLAPLLGSLGLVATVMGRYAEAREYLEEGFDLARTLEDRRIEAMIRGYLGDLCRLEGRPEEAVTWLSSAVDGHRKVGHQRFWALDQLSLAEALRDAQRPKEAVDAARAAVPALAALKEPRAEGLALALIAELGPASEAGALFDQAEQRLMGAGARLQLALVHCGRARVALREGQDGRPWYLKAQKAAEGLPLEPGSELGRALAALEEQLS